MKKFILITAVLLSSGEGFAQKIDTSQTRMSETISKSENDKQFLKDALEGGNAEIKKGALARSKSKNPEIIKYGEMMERDHHSVNMKLKEIAHQKGFTISDDLNSEHLKKYNSLEKMNGEAFDKEFIAQMIADHKQAISLFKKQIENGKDEQLKTLAADALPSLEIHLKEIERLQERIIK